MRAAWPRDLRPITETIPKALVDVAGKPFILRQLDYLRRQGVGRVVLCVGYLGEQIEAVVGDGSALRAVGILFAGLAQFAGNRRRAEAGPAASGLPVLRPVRRLLSSDRFCLRRAGFLASGKPALMTVLRNADRWDKSNVLFRDDVIVEYNKRAPTPDMRHIDYGLGAMSAQVLADEDTTGPFDLADVYHRLSLSGQLAGYEVHERFYEIGSHEGLAGSGGLFQGQGKVMGYAEQHLREAAEIIEKMDLAPIEKMADLLAQVKADGGRLFFLGVGGSAGNCSHAVNDFRKIVGIECYAPTDNVSELTARTNDEGWATIFVEWLKISKLLAKDAVFIFSVGGGNLEKNISPNLVTALQHAKTVGAKIIGIVGRDGGYTAQVADACVIVPTVNPENVTPHSEAFQAVVWHLLVSHPKLKANQTKWESRSGR